LGEPVEDEVGADESGAAGNQDGAGVGEHRDKCTAERGQGVGRRVEARRKQGI
jgi:hypothetical protein